MSFMENLKQVRKEHQLSQEDLAELLDVSRQAVSKWESGQGYPEVEKLLLLARKLNLSLDELMSEEIGGGVRGTAAAEVTGSIVITSPHENVIATCSKVQASGKMRGGKHAPQYILFGDSANGLSRWGDPHTLLGWYANEEQLSKEVEEIRKAIAKGLPTYTLQYSVKTRQRWMSVKMVE